jgi:hypothetical protein
LRQLQLADYGAEDIWPRREIACPDAVADSIDLHRRHLAEALGELREDRGAGGGNEFVRLIELPERNPTEDLEGRRCRDGERTVRTLDGAVAILKRRRIDLLNTESVDTHAGHDDIGNRIESADFVKVHLLRGDAVNLPLGLGDATKNGKGALLYGS